jgi:hypothetical protein
MTDVLCRLVGRPAQARKLGAGGATPYRRRATAGFRRHTVLLEGGREVAARAGVLATGAD